MTEPDDVLDILRRARPDDLADELASPQSRTAQALLEEILSVQTTRTPGTRKDVAVIRRPVGGSRRGRALVGAAAAAGWSARAGSPRARPARSGTGVRPARRRGRRVVPGHHRS